MVQALFFLSLGGILAGLLAGLLGVGGGIVLVPLLTLILPQLGIASDVVMHIAVATSMAVITITSLSSARVHWQQRQVIWPVFFHLTTGTVLGTLLGVNIAHLLPSNELHLIFGVFTLVIALHILLNKQPKVQREIPNKYLLALGGFIIGTVCALLGMGGGMLIVPYLNHYKLSMRNIISTSTLCTIPIALAGSMGFILLGHEHAPLRNVSYTTGYIYWPAFFATAAAGVVFAPIGAKLAHRIPAKVLKRIFGGFLIIVATHMLITGIN